MTSSGSISREQFGHSKGAGALDEATIANTKPGIAIGAPEDTGSVKKEQDKAQTGEDGGQMSKSQQKKLLKEQQIAEKKRAKEAAKAAGQAQ